MWDDPRQLNAAAAGLVLVAAALLAWGFVAWAARQPAFAFREVVVRGPLEHASAAHLEAVIRDELAGTFFTMNLDRARAALSRVPWVKGVALRRQWPRRLEVTIDEHVPLARWNDAALIDGDGEVFGADYDGELPQFAGPDDRAAEVAARYREWSAVLAPLALTTREVRLSARGGWQVGATGAGGPLELELGRDEPAARLARFVAVWGRTLGPLARAGTRIDHVDLRYRNGFAARVPGFKERPPKKAAA
jgi:cell division protein FtsQ